MLTRLQRLAVRLRHPIVISAIVGCALSVAASRALINVGGAAKVDLYRRAANNRLTTIQRLAETDLALVRSVAQSLELAPPGMNETHARRWLCPFAGDSHDLRLFGFLPLSSSTGLADSIALHNCRPAAGDQRVVLETNRRWKKFLDQSTASGQPVLTPAFRPEIEGQTGAVSLILMPVLDRGRLRGHAVAALEYSRVVERAVARFESYGVHVGLTEWTPGEPERMLAFHQSRRAETRIQPLETVIEAETASGSVTTTVNVGGRRWLGYCLPVPEVVQPEPSAGLGALVFGLFATAMLCLYLRSMQARTRVVEKLVTHRTQELAAARDQAVEASKLKSDFLATVSHEVRTPLNGVMGLTDLLAETPLNGDQRDLVDSLRGSATSLMVILNDILDLSKMEAGKFSLASEPFDLPAVVEQATQLFAGQAAKKGLSLSCQLPDEVCLRLEGDAGRLGQVLSNLVGNAVKFTNQGMVSVSVELLARQAEVAEFCISVRDTGIGIDPVLGRKLFQPFTQVDASSARRHGGTGLGLAICRELTEMMGGQIMATSAPGMGSTFTAILPLKRVARAAPKPRRATVGRIKPAERRRSLQAEARELRVLAAEDNPMNQLVLKTL
ncbi:MAG: ATP-binding protein, partial [Acidobacteria bacterium]|nr:ATP-binding protein [Acidobacteriota bacterium]